jgi:methylated-DNA-protein-cysteine methyltransferase related protein
VPSRSTPATKPLTGFAAQVRRVVRSIPPGTTLSYGMVAERAGKPGAARAVVRALYTLHDVPWWRVARRDGTLAPQIAARQAKLLRSEGWRPRQRTPGPTREGKRAPGRRRG